MQRKIIKTLILSAITVGMVSNGVVASSVVPETITNLKDVPVKSSLDGKQDDTAVAVTEKAFEPHLYVVNGVLYIENVKPNTTTSWVEVAYKAKSDVQLINKSFPLPQNLYPEMDNKCRVRLEKNCSSALRNMQAGCQLSTGRWPAAISGYRDFGYQSRLFNRYLKTNRGDWQKVNSFAAVMGQSEHHTGLAVDLVSDKESFANTKEYAWLKNNCYKYGFIERYPTSKTSITGYIWEPWHYRYVGSFFAEYLHTNGLTMEEFYQQLQNQKYVQIGSKYVRLVPNFYYATATQSTNIEVYTTNTGKSIVVTDY